MAHFGAHGGRDGALLHRFASQLPAGSRATAEGHDAACILDCILHQVRPQGRGGSCTSLARRLLKLPLPPCARQDGTFYIVDAMCWRGYNLCVRPAPR